MKSKFCWSLLVFLLNFGFPWSRFWIIEIICRGPFDHLAWKWRNNRCKLIWFLYYFSFEMFMFLLFSFNSIYLENKNRDKTQSLCVFRSSSVCWNILAHKKRLIEVVDLERANEKRSLAWCWMYFSLKKKTHRNCWNWIDGNKYKEEMIILWGIDRCASAQYSRISLYISVYACNNDQFGWPSNRRPMLCVAFFFFLFSFSFKCFCCCFSGLFCFVHFAWLESWL